MTWRILWFLIKLGLIGAVALWLVREPGQISIDWLGWAIDMPVGIAALIIGLVIAVFVYGDRIIQTVFALPERWRDYRAARREVKGYRALTMGLVAIAAGDPAESRKQTRRARDLLSDVPLTKLVRGQTAQLSGDTDAARTFFEDMRKDPDVAFLGLRGLTMQALQEGDTERALTLAKEAQRLRPSAHQVAKQVLDLEILLDKSEDALRTLENMDRNGAMPSEKATVLRSDLSSELARKRASEGDHKLALSLAEKALKATPDAEHVIALTAELRAAAGKTAKAQKLIEETWKTNPTEGLASTYLSLNADPGDALAQVKTIERLAGFAPDHPESHLVLVDSYLHAQLWGEARSHLAKAGTILGEPLPSRLCRLWARVEEGEHGDFATAHEWLRRATEAADREEQERQAKELPILNPTAPDPIV